MTNPGQPRRFSRSAFILKHLASVIAAGILGYVTAIYPLLFLAAIAPLLAVPKAGREDRKTFILSTVLALLLMACVYGLGLLLFVMSLGSANWR